MTNTRENALTHWLENTCHLSIQALTALKGDASFRRYYRLQTVKQSYVVMDAPAETGSCVPFVTIAAALKKMGLHTPQVYHQDLNRGFLVLADFGDQLLLNELTIKNVQPFYQQALVALQHAQQTFVNAATELPTFTAEFMRNELLLWQDWFLEQFLNIELTSGQKSLLAHVFKMLANAAAEQPYAFMHRDYHAANLMVLGRNQLGILDFQDAFYGPVTYDAVSLLRDCYVTWPAELITQLALEFKNTSSFLKPYSDSVFITMFDNMALQRHLKALLTFSRKSVRDQDDRYLTFVRPTMAYVLHEAKWYPEFQQFLTNIVCPCLQERNPLCVE